MPFLRDRKNWNVSRLLLRTFFPKVTGSKFGDSLSVQLSRKLSNYVFEDDLIPPQSPGKGLQVTNLDHCLHIVRVIMKCTDVFRGRFFKLGWGWIRGVCLRGSFHGQFIKREENFHEGGTEFSSIIKK